jgi:uncharacterized iron-regulated protein
MKIFSGIMLMFSLLSVMNSAAFATPRIYRVSDRTQVEYPNFINDIRPARVVFIGEIHDSMKQHENQLEIIKSLYAKDASIAIGLEQFTFENQAQLDAWTSGAMDEQAFKPLFAGNWSYGWQYYRDIFLFAREKRIPMVALNVPQSIATKVVRQGATALNDDDRKLIPPHMSWTLNPTQAEYFKQIRKAFGNRTPPYPVSNFNEAQVLRDNVMAWNIEKYADTHPKDKIIVLTGTWHAIRTGVPEQLRHYGELAYKVVLPESPAFIIQNFTEAQTDYFILE